jgi:hypothetical protein
VKIVEPSVSLIWATEEPIFTIERIGRVCYKSEDKMGCDCSDGKCPACRGRAE